MRPLAEECMSSDGNFSSFWLPEKAIPTVSLNPPIQANWLYVNHCSTFWFVENVILQGFM
jgi:hypothetical protein